MYYKTIENYFGGEKKGRHGKTLSPCRPKSMEEKYEEFDKIYKKCIENIDKQDIVYIRPLIEHIAEKGIEYTQTFLPQLHDNYNPSTLRDIVKSELIKVSVKSNEFIELVLIGEFSEIGRFHMHGVLNASPELVNRLKRRLTRLIGRVELKQITYTESYIDYMLKSENKYDYMGTNKPIRINLNIVYHG